MQVYQDLEPNYVGNGFMFNWVFHYNPFTEVWAAIHRDDYNKYWDKMDCKRCLRSKNVSDLKELLYQLKGDPAEVEKFIND